MTYKHVLAPVITLEADEAALAAAGEIAAKFEAKATALIVAVHISSSFAEFQQPLSVVLQDIAQGARSQAAQERARIVAWLERHAPEMEVRDLTIEHAAGEDRIAAHAHAADLVVMARADGHDLARRELIEDVLFKSGRPLLLIPARPPRRFVSDKIVIGWNARQEAVRAVAAAMPFLRAARQVVVATVDATPSPAGHGEKPGRDFAAYLARHGLTVEVRNIDGMGRTDARALIDEARAIDADMLVLGAYGHSRAREFLFGGVTRELLAASPIPLFLAH
jgi:nucleotide-binding universal stress UspA family protein